MNGIRWVAAAAALLMTGMVMAQSAPAGAVKVQKMAADADPSFEVATIKPNAGAGHSPVNLHGDHYAAQGVSVADLVTLAYRKHGDEVVGLPEWAMQERYDIAATTQPEGQANLDQLRTMLKKLLAQRFGMVEHSEQRVLPVYVLMVAKGGAKMKLSQKAGSGDTEHGVEGGIEMTYTGATAKMFADFLQQGVVDRTVIDKTGLTERYDFDVTFLPDGSMFGGRVHFPANAPNAAPSLFTALEEIGLKLSPEKLPVDVVVVDKVERPSGN